MCLPKPKMPDFNAQMKAQQEELAKQRQADAEAERDATMRKARADAKRLQKRRRGRSTLISRTGGSGSLGILDYTPTTAGLRPLGEGTLA
jgi:hypothetical protein